MRREVERTGADIMTILGLIVVVFFTLYFIFAFVFATFFAQ